MKHLYANYQRLFTTLLFLFFIISATKANIYWVTNANSNGTGSFGDALFNASFVHIGKDTINFNIPGSGPFIIKPATAGFPNISDPVFINGYSQPGSNAGTFTSRKIAIVLDGAGVTNYLSGLSVNSTDVQISGLNIRNFAESGIVINGKLHDISIWGCFIGTNETGTTAAPNGRNGIRTTSGTTDSSWHITIGTNGDGTNDAWEGNIIDAGKDNGIAFSLLRNSTIAGNYIGIGANGIEKIGNTNAGIVLDKRSKNNIIGTNADGISDSLEMNVIGNNGTYGVWLYNSSDSNMVAGNRIGLDATYNPAPNLMGVIIWNASNNTIGVTTSLVQANTISANTKYGVKLQAGDYYAALGGATTQQNMISGNFIGTYAPGTVARGNGIFGIYAEAMSGYDVINNFIGSNNDGSHDIIEGNTIAYNMQSGISTYTGFAGTGKLTGLTISRNRMYGNVELGIDLKTDLVAGRGVSSNHNTPLTGPNNYVNAPVLVSVADDGDNFIINGFSDPGATVELFKADGKHPSNPLPAGFTKNFGEGIVFYFRLKEGGVLDGYGDNSALTGTYTKTVEGNNNSATINASAFSFAIPKVLFPGLTTTTGLTATATDANGNTSEFSGVVLPPVNAPLPVNFISFTGTLVNGKTNLNWITQNEMSNAYFDVERSGDGQTFTVLGTVAATRTAESNYSFTDASPLSVNYYRLKQVDINGNFKYSQIIMLKADAAVQISISPNPFADHLNISFELEDAGKVQVHIYDMLGRLIKRFELNGVKGYNYESISNLGNLPSGQYIIQLSGEGLQKQFKVVK